MIDTLSSGEVNFLWWFMQGSIMEPDVRWSLRRSWGFCDRHTLAWLNVEAAFRHGYLHGPAVLYGDLMERAQAAFELAGPLVERRLAHHLRTRGTCNMCTLGLGPDSQGFTVGDRLQVGRDISQLRDFMDETRAFWRDTVCGACERNSSPIRCRAHLCAAIERGAAHWLDANRSQVLWIARHIRRYGESFVWEKRGSDTAQDRAALISAAGWCGGWRGLLSLYKDAP